MENNDWGVFLIPSEDTSDGEGCFMALTAQSENRGDIDKIEDVVPANWKSLTFHTYDVEDFVAEISRMPDFSCPADLLQTYEADGITHLSLIESEIAEKTAQPFYFGHAKRISGNSMVVMWSGHRGKHRFIHCGQCANVIIHWLQEMQGEWYRAECLGFQAKAPTLN